MRLHYHVREENLHNFSGRLHVKLKFVSGDSSIEEIARFIERNHGWLACSLDDLATDIPAQDPLGIAEYKCPHSVKDTQTMEEASKRKKIPCTAHEWQTCPKAELQPLLLSARVHGS